MRRRVAYILLNTQRFSPLPAFDQSLLFGGQAAAAVTAAAILAVNVSWTGPNKDATSTPTMITQRRRMHSPRIKGT
ncbi:hypothetical protein GCM10020216_032410 [Nonomuraea helvata]